VYTEILRFAQDDGIGSGWFKACSLLRLGQEVNTEILRFAQDDEDGGESSQIPRFAQDDNPPSRAKAKAIGYNTTLRNGRLLSLGDFVEVYLSLRRQGMHRILANQIGIREFGGLYIQKRQLLQPAEMIDR